MDRRELFERRELAIPGSSQVVAAVFLDGSKPLWRNKLTIDNLEVSGTGYHWLVDVVNDQRLGWKYIEELGKNKPTLERVNIEVPGKAIFVEDLAAHPRFTEKITSLVMSWLFPARFL